MVILVIDGQGGRLGKQIVERVSKEFPDAEVLAIGTNSIATATMLKGGASEAATGENPVVVGCRRADVIIGPIGIVMANSLLGEVTDTMANAIARSSAFRVLIPMNKCDNLVAGVTGQSVNDLIDDAVEKIKDMKSC